MTPKLKPSTPSPGYPTKHEAEVLKDAFCGYSISITPGEATAERPFWLEIIRKSDMNLFLIQERKNHK